MCGIVGYKGYKRAYPISVRSLKRLEYRFYNKGVVWADENRQLKICKMTEISVNLNKMQLLNLVPPENIS